MYMFYNFVSSELSSDNVTLSHPVWQVPLKKLGNPETGWAILKDELPVLKLGSGENRTAEDEVGQEESPENVKDLRSQEGNCRPTTTHLEQIGETGL